MILSEIIINITSSICFCKIVLNLHFKICTEILCPEWVSCKPENIRVLE